MADDDAILMHFFFVKLPVRNSISRQAATLTAIAISQNCERVDDVTESSRCILGSYEGLSEVHSKGQYSIGPKRTRDLHAKRCLSYSVIYHRSSLKFSRNSVYIGSGLLPWKYRA